MYHKPFKKNQSSLEVQTMQENGNGKKGRLFAKKVILQGLKSHLLH
jgi:hypothetical protein